MTLESKPNTPPNSGALERVILRNNFYRDNFHRATEAAINAYTFNYVNYRKALQDVRIYFTKDGYQYFLKALKDSNNLDAVIEKKMIVSAKPTGSPTILNKGVAKEGPNAGVYLWYVEMPMEIYFQNESTPIRQSIILNMIIARVPTLDSPSGVGITSFVLREGKSP